ncbi:arsenate reductase family protein [Tropicimonas sp. S265A]|uniref:arsenate reductase family protein n=1 Tax=Tropicimonas sp. S265A TaxID=3415134 RepID=UPI003C7A4DA2
MRIYGLKTCDTCRKAAKGLNAAMQDIRAEPLNPDQIDQFLAAFGEALVNRRSTTWRGLTEAEREMPPKQLLERHPTVMKRPVIEDATGALYLGWGSDVKARLL